MSLYYAVLIEGLRNPLNASDPNPVLFVHGDLSSFVPPGSLGTVTISGFLDSTDPGEGWSSDVRRPIGSGGAQAIRLIDTPAGDLGKILLFDPNETTWDLSTSVLAEGALSVTVSGPQVPNNGLYWIEEECIEVTAVAPVAMGGGTSALSYALTIVRGRCGSRDRTHEVQSSAIAPGEDGTEERLILWQRPRFGVYRFRGTMYLFDTLYSVGTAEILEARHFFVEKEPLAGIPAYEIELRDVAEVIEQQVWQLAQSVPLPYRLFVVSEGVEFVPIPGTALQPIVVTRKIPAACRLYLDRIRAWQLFSTALSEVGQNGFWSPFVTSLKNRLFKAGGDCAPLIHLTTRDQVWIYRITDVNLPAYTPASVGAPPAIIIDLSLKDHTPGAHLDQEAEESGDPGADSPDTDDYPNKAFTRQLETDLRPPRVPLSEDVPTLALWYQLNTTPVNAYLYLTTSYGGHSTDPYDVILGPGVGIPADWQERGIAPANPLSALWGTTELLALNRLLSEEYTYYVRSGDKLGDFLTNLCLLHTLLHAPLNSGALTLRRWARPLDPGVLTSLDPVIELPVSPGERLTPLRAFLLYSGIKSLTLEPEYVRTVTLGGHLAREIGPATTVRVWQAGNQLTDDLIQQGTIGHLLRAFFSTMGGAPIRYTVPCHVRAQQLEPGDLVLWSNDRIPTPQGRGFTNVRFIVVGADLNYRTGIKEYRLLRDYYNELAQSLGQIAPTLKPHIPEFIGTTVEIQVTSQGDPSFNAPLDHGGVWQDLLTTSGYVRVLSPVIHNPTDEDDPVGWGEIYGEIVGARFDAGTNTSILTVQFDASWERSGVTLRDVITEDAVLSLVDRKPPGANPQGVLIEPIQSQLAAGNDFLSFAAKQSFQRNFSVIG